MISPLPSIPRVDRERCTGCGRCVAACPGKLFTLEPVAYRKTALLADPDRCTLCNSCIEECPVGAIHAHAS